jgi:hypothetical protein
MSEPDLARHAETYDRVGDVVAGAASFLLWSSAWFYMRSSQAERRKKREDQAARDAA